MVSRVFLVPVAVTLLVFASMGYRAQDKLSLLDKIKQSITASEPEFELQKTVPLESGVFIRFASKEGDALIMIEEFPSPKDSYAQMLHVAQLVAVGTGKKLKDLGDEANVWENYGSELRTTIHFRRGTLLILVNASSTEIANRFGRHVADQIQVDPAGKSLDKIN